MSRIDSRFSNNRSVWRAVSRACALRFNAQTAGIYGGAIVERAPFAAV